MAVNGGGGAQGKERRKWVLRSHLYLTHLSVLITAISNSIAFAMYTEPGTTAKQSNVLALSTTLSRYAAVDIQETETSAHVCTQHLQMYCNVHCQSQNISLPQPFVRVVIMFVRHPIHVCVLLAGQKVSSIQYHCSHWIVVLMYRYR